MESLCFSHQHASSAANVKYVDWCFSIKVLGECEVGNHHPKYSTDAFKAYNIAYTLQNFTEDVQKYDDVYVDGQCDLLLSASHL